MEPFEPAKGLLDAYRQLLGLEADALAQMADAADDPKRLAAAASRLDFLDQATAEVTAAQGDLLASFPEMDCGAAPIDAGTWVVLPTYNERDNISTIVPAIRAALPNAVVLIVDDGSPDGTGVIADEFAASDALVRVLHRTAKAGLARAYVAGFDVALAAGAVCVVQMDADWSHPPSVLPVLVGGIEGGADLVLGSRYARGGGTQGWPLTRRIISRGGNLYSQLILWLPYPDLTGGFRAWRAATLRAVRPATIEATGYVFMIELVFRAHSLGAQITQVPFVFTERRAGASKMSSGIFFEAFRHVLLLRVRRILGRNRR
jgi:dolichol-phosphate mannosyltransferase